MKALILGVVVLLVCAVLFVTGVISPGRSRRMQRGVGRVANKGKRKGDNNAGRFGDMTRDMLQHAHDAADASAEKGRELHNRGRS